MRRIAITVAIVFLVSAGNAFAGAKQHFMAGQDYYTQGRYEKAIEEFEEAYRLDPRPLLLFNIAQAHEKMGHLEKAVEYLKRYLESDTETEDRTTLLSKVANLEGRIAKTGIEVKVNEPEASVFVDGDEVGKSPVSGVIKLSVGHHKVVVAKIGFDDFTINVAVASGQTVPVEAELEPGSSKMLGAEATAPTAEEPAEEPQEAEEEPDEDDGVTAMDVVPWVVAGVGGAGAAVGFGVIGGMAKSEEDHSKAVIADIVGFSGVALAVGGTIWGLYNVLSDDESPGEAQVSAVPVFNRSTVGVAAAVTF